MNDDHRRQAGRLYRVDAFDRETCGFGSGLSRAPSLMQMDSSNGEQPKTAGEDQQTLRDRHPVIVLLSRGQEVKRYEKEIAQAERHQDNPSNERQGEQRDSHAYICCHSMPYRNLPDASERFSSDRGEGVGEDRRNAPMRRYRVSPDCRRISADDDFQAHIPSNP